jgi:hypothetical protein
VREAVQCGLPIYILRTGSDLAVKVTPCKFYFKYVLYALKGAEHKHSVTVTMFRPVLFSYLNKITLLSEGFDEYTDFTKAFFTRKILLGLLYRKCNFYFHACKKITSFPMLIFTKL